MDPFQIKFHDFHILVLNSSKTIYLNLKFLGKWMLNPQEGGRLDAKRHYVILAFGQLIMPVQCCAEARRRQVPQHSTAQA